MKIMKFHVFSTSINEDVSCLIFWRQSNRIDSYRVPEDNLAALRAGAGTPSTLLEPASPDESRTSSDSKILGKLVFLKNPEFLENPDFLENS